MDPDGDVVRSIDRDYIDLNRLDGAVVAKVLRDGAVSKRAGEHALVGKGITAAPWESI